ncbi:hypothetical protein [Nocardia brasiliensis]|uniref:hypothetical protein n=1 Tax=Nocardia brasiliensis TaxID=37326 RepID=UPI002458B45F|nr:hypothetical protein [Nocardia brasiliensis]
MATIRNDLDGIVCAFRENGEVVQLQAGDTIPPDIRLGAHLIESDSPVTEPEPEPEAAERPVDEAPKRRGRPPKGSGGA